MKKGTTIIAFLLLHTFVNGQDCNIGNQDTTGFDNNYSGYSPDYISGYSFTLADTGTLQSINLMGLVAGSPVQMAVYSDISGAPGDLIAASSIDTVVTGVNSFPVSPVQLIPGDYWVMAAFGILEWSVYHHSLNQATIYYLPLPFGSPIPATGAGFQSNTVAASAYYLEIACLSSGVQSIYGNADIKTYPNPAGDVVYLSTSQNYNQYSIQDAYGRLVKRGAIENQIESIEIGELNSGLYFVLLYDESNRTVIRKIVKM